MGRISGRPDASSRPVGTLVPDVTYPAWASPLNTFWPARSGRRPRTPRWGRRGGGGSPRGPLRPAGAARAPRAGVRARRAPRTPTRPPDGAPRSARARSRRSGSRSLPDRRRARVRRAEAPPGGAGSHVRRGRPAPPPPRRAGSRCARSPPARRRARSRPARPCSRCARREVPAFEAGCGMAVASLLGEGAGRRHGFEHPLGVRALQGDHGERLALVVEADGAFETRLDPLEVVGTVRGVDDEEEIVLAKR